MKKFFYYCVLFFGFFLLHACRTHPSSTIINAPQKSAAAVANVKLGIAFLKEGFTRNAKEKLLIAEQLDSKNPAVWYSFGYYYESTGNYEQAVKCYLKAIQLCPHDGASHNNYGTFLCCHGDYQNAIKHFLLAAEDRQYLECAGSYENAGLCCLKIPDYVQAKKFFLKAIVEDPRLVSSQFYLAELAFHQHNFNEAKSYLMRPSLTSNPTEHTRQLAKEIANKLHDRSLLTIYELKES